MPKYIAHIVERVERTLELEADSPQEALKEIQKCLTKYEDWNFRHIESDNGITILDAETDKPLLNEYDDGSE